ncbi:hypothetical protein [Pararhodobacter sp. SW119]|uniref:hypothetical protein n=1 Tax=Pararhodobacter sp. SW119 TaxID=2780075 RepID=UPI001ADEF97C|nr:hypothetical protein [Pararhodobacter sp. SW119]
MRASEAGLTAPVFRANVGDDASATLAGAGQQTDAAQAKAGASPSTSWQQVSGAAAGAIVSAWDGTCG